MTRRTYHLQSYGNWYAYNPGRYARRFRRSYSRSARQAVARELRNS